MGIHSESAVVILESTMAISHAVSKQYFHSRGTTYNNSLLNTCTVSC